MNRNNPILYIVIPCYNEEKVLPYTNPMFIEKIELHLVDRYSTGKYQGDYYYAPGYGSRWSD